VEGLAGLSTDQKRAALQEVLESEALARSDQLRSFLSYVGEMAISGRAREITEYQIAVEALGRPADFSPTDDSSVRSRAHELRRKLQRYYETENPRAPVRVELPKGAYCPRFLLREEAAQNALHEHAEAPSPPEPGAAPVHTEHDKAQAGLVPAAPPVRRPARFSRRETALVAALAVFVPCAAYLGYGLRRGDSGRQFDPVIVKAWGPLARPNADVLLCFASSLHLVVRPYMAVVAEGFPKYPAPPELYAFFRQHRPLPEGTELSMHPVDNSVQMGQLASVVALANTLHDGGVRYQVLPERAARITVMRGRNVILIGEPQDSEAAALYLDKMPITVEYDPAVQDVVVRDRRHPGHPRAFVPKRGPDKRYTEVYGLITVTPTPEATGDQRSVIISGLTSVGEQGAAEFFSSVKALSSLLERFRSEGRSGFPSGYQVVLRCNSRDTLLISTVYETHVVFRP
jgi:hypothetical protein